MAEDNRSSGPMMGRDAAALAVYNDLKESQRATFQVAAEWGRWLIGSLVLVHSGALFGMFSLLNNATAAQATNALQSFKIPVWCFVFGLLLALVSGLCAWVNWSMHSFNYMAQARYDMLWDPAKWVGDRKYVRGLDVTNIVSIVAGVLSALCIALGAATILHGQFLTAVLGL
ncbi:hypothetical protein RFN28_18565 [Mesorhizobium sp. VK24D]|uniref:Uncharacterized protein n=1 Tax=Mesorhizobium album TaxID=3072314 RepID=A0ABU4Y0H8_9HYPH|nr:hypothetical protein [Mesorhizobium sp. VK24D]MDX8480451.1 hypothetical protein [Mesorhizobium sp. VK24D]